MTRYCSGLTTFQKVLLAIDGEKDTSTKLFKKMDITFSSTSAIINGFETLGIINRIKEGRERKIKLTNKGKEMKASLSKYRTLLNER